jgi:glycosyltransferase involved in cell wall biosynthesis
MLVDPAARTPEENSRMLTDDPSLNAAPSSLSLSEDKGDTRPRVSVVVPTLNEERNVAWVLERLPELVDEVILVDGRSTDRTIEVARAVRPDIRVVLESQPGKGAALRAGFAAARGDYIVMIDADGSMDPAEIKRFVDALQSGCDFVKGSRFATGGGTVDMSRIRKFGNDALRTAVNVLYRTNFTDLCYGFIGFRRERLRALRLGSQGFEIETEMIVRAVIASLRITEVASFEAERRYGESNLSAWRDGRRALRTLLRERFILPASPVSPIPGRAR